MSADASEPGLSEPPVSEARALDLPKDAAAADPPKTRCPRCGARPDLGEGRCTTCGVEMSSVEASEGIKRRGGAVREFFRGIVYFPKGLYTILTQRALWLTAAVPAILNAVFLALSIWLAIELHEYLVQDVEDNIALWEGVFWGQVMWGLVKVLIYLAELLGIIVVPLIVAWLFAVFGKVLFMPFMEVLSARTEKVLLGELVDDEFTFARFSGDLVIGVVNGLLLAALQVGLMIILLPIVIVPIVGGLLWFILPGAVFASMDYTDLSFVRRRYGVRERTSLWWRRKWRFFGFGFAFFAFLAIPYLNIITGVFVIPIACVGGTLLFLELDDKG